jgi:hypothetical protein
LREQSGDTDKAIADYRLALARDKNLTGARTALAAVEDRIEKARVAAREQAEQMKAAAAQKPGAKKSRVKTAKAEPHETKAEPPETVAAPMPVARPEPEVTGTIEAAKPASRIKRETRRETKRERAIREYKERREAALEKIRHQRAQRAEQARRAPQAPMRDLSPAEKRRLYFRALEQKQRAAQHRGRREANFADAFR